MTRVLGAVLAMWAAAALAQDADRPFMGVKGAPLSAEEAEALGIPGGGRVDWVYPNGGAARAGLKRGDVIVQADGQQVFGFFDMVSFVRKKKIGDEVALTVQRGSEKKDLKVTLGSYREFSTMKGAAAPPLRVDEWIGEPVDLAALKGKVVVLVFWSIKSETWKLLEPDYQALAKELGGKFTTIGIHVANDRFEEQTPEAVKAALQEHPFAGSVALASGARMKRAQDGRGEPLVQVDYRFQQLPAIIVIDAEGKVAFKSEGADLYVSDVRKALQDVAK